MTSGFYVQRKKDSLGTDDKRDDPKLDDNGALRKRSSNRRNLKTPALRFSVDRKRFVVV